jgi:ppGpp synthetase/RelA/SpoT-type nucleotidyltranferase
MEMDMNGIMNMKSRIYGMESDMEEIKEKMDYIEKEEDYIGKENNEEEDIISDRIKKIKKIWEKIKKMMKESE